MTGVREYSGGGERGQREIVEDSGVTDGFNSSVGDGGVGRRVGPGKVRKRQGEVAVSRTLGREECEMERWEELD